MSLYIVLKDYFVGFEPATSNVTDQRIKSAEDSVAIVRLRADGMAIDDIATHLGLHPSTVGRLLKKALDRYIAPEVAQLRSLEAVKLDEVEEAVWEKAMKGNLPAIDRVIRVMERRAKLFGLDMKPSEDLGKDEGPKVLDVRIWKAVDAEATEVGPAKEVQFPADRALSAPNKGVDE